MNKDEVISDLMEDLRDTRGDYKGALERSYRNAMRRLRREKIYTNQKREIKIVTDGENTLYPLPDIIDIVNIKCLIGTVWLKMEKVKPTDLDIMAETTEPIGYPVWWEYFDNSIKFFPRPMKNLQIMITASVSGNEIGDVFPDDIYGLVYNLTKYYLSVDVTMDADVAAASLQRYNDELKSVQIEGQRKISTGVIDPSW